MRIPRTPVGGEVCANSVNKWKAPLAATNATMLDKATPMRRVENRVRYRGPIVRLLAEVSNLSVERCLLFLEAMRVTGRKVRKKQNKARRIFCQFRPISFCLDGGKPVASKGPPPRTQFADRRKSLRRLSLLRLGWCRGFCQHLLLGKSIKPCSRVGRNCRRIVRVDSDHQAFPAALLDSPASKFGQMSPQASTTHFDV